ncbi:TRAP transporter small permease [Amorphus orientalis]|uniref:TRAP transporter small permease protein n=1 Tax=Amorphus orientalis TaxID=649198 RepID=A0AAE3VKX9_9HYPH|nr:TRAP transporter small permease [Amorphus orientalis]MDQ0313611.1 TRAP-type C4-dicarboxylate transport system permease small subunit [Amorphus orientalis]
MSELDQLDGDIRSTGGMHLTATRALARVTFWLGLAGVATLIVAIVLTCADILWRRLVGGAFVDTFDITKLCLVAAASLSIPYGFTQGAHITVDIVADKFPKRLRHVIDIVISVISAALMAFLLWLSWQAAMLYYAYGDTTLNLQLPIIWYWAIFMTGLGLAVLAALARAIDAALCGQPEQSS